MDECDMPRKKYAGKTDIGLQRKNNEDAFFFSPDQHFCLTADGVGGAAAGGLASKIFTESTYFVRKQIDVNFLSSCVL